MAAIAASLIASGTGKSGWPIERLIGFAILAARSKTLRMPELSNFEVRSASQGCGVMCVGRAARSVDQRLSASRLWAARTIDGQDCPSYQRTTQPATQAG